MGNSSLATCRIISPYKTSPRNHEIDRITIHCTVGQGTAETICNVLRQPGKNASCNYAIGKDGSIGVCVDESDRSWCSSSPSNDNRAVTIEVSSDSKYPYRVTEAAYNSLLRLCVDICRRHNKDTLMWIKDKETALYQALKENEMKITVHRWFAATDCPGDYLMEKMPYIANSVTTALQEVHDATDADKIHSTPRYSKYEDIPQWGKATIQKLIHKGYIFGVETQNGPELDISLDMLRIFVILDRAKVFD